VAEEEAQVPVVLVPGEEQAVRVQVALQEAQAVTERATLQPTRLAQVVVEAAVVATEQAAAQAEPVEQARTASLLSTGVLVDLSQDL
jgi:hypothetical protein